MSEEEEPELHEIVERLANSANLPKPQIAIAENDALNAFATGRDPNHAIIAITGGAKDLLSKKEIEGVLGHEMAHIKNRDMLVNTMAAVIAGAITYIGLAGRFGLFFGGGRRGGGGILALIALMLMPIAAMMIRFSISRTREYGADEEGAEISGKPLALASGLKSIEKSVKGKLKRGEAPQKGNPATSHLFIVNPFRGVSLTELFSTHPSTEKRVERLENLTREK
ncbi:MAG: M48 family metalloprotease [Hadesarchaea archaeon]|nr:M48 family metalloprotease [Hadesarchaea archaeon]